MSEVQYVLISSRINVLRGASLHVRAGPSYFIHAKLKGSLQDGSSSWSTKSIISNTCGAKTHGLLNKKKASFQNEF